MAYLPDMSDYCYLERFIRPGTKAVGWLDGEHAFRREPPHESLLDCLWDVCKTSVAATRGGHPCPFCQHRGGTEAERNGESLLLGTAEIRVFSRDGQIYAASTLIYHYVQVHHYRPPVEFVRAVLEGPRPPSVEYFDLLRGLKLEWGTTPAGGQGYFDRQTYDPDLDSHTPIIDLMRRSKPKTTPE
jgi:hypothetical protein